jgi:hypothetical protein
MKNVFNKLFLGLLVTTSTGSFAQPMMSSFFALNSACETQADLARFNLALRASVLQADDVHGRAGDQELIDEKVRVRNFQNAYSKCLELESAVEKAKIEPGADLKSALAALETAVTALKKSTPSDGSYTSAYADDAKITQLLEASYGKSLKFIRSASSYSASVEILRSQLRDKFAGLLQKATACRILLRGGLNVKPCVLALEAATKDAMLSIDNNRTVAGAPEKVSCQLNLPTTCGIKAPTTIRSLNQPLKDCLSSAIFAQRKYECVQAVRVTALSDRGIVIAQRTSDELSVNEMLGAIRSKEQALQAASTDADKAMSDVNAVRDQFQKLDGELRFLGQTALPNLGAEMQWRMGRAQALQPWIAHLRGPGSKWFVDMWHYCNNTAWYYWNIGWYGWAYWYWAESKKYADGFAYTQNVLIPQAENEMRDHQTKIPQIQQQLAQMEQRVRELQQVLPGLANQMKGLEEKAQITTSALLGARSAIIGLQAYEMKLKKEKQNVN